MSTSIEEIKVFRFYFIGQYDQLVLNVKANNTYCCYSCSSSSGLSEKEAVSIIANDFAKDYKSEYYKEKIVQGFHQLRLRPVTDTFSDYIDIPVLPNQLEPHFSCKMKNVDSSTTDLKVNEVSQCELKQKLTETDKDSETMKFFEDNKCSVCLSNYKEIVDECLHIVVPSCGHPLCCKCADNILVSEKKECPSCRGFITAQSFDLMKFNGDLTVNFEDKRLFL